MAWAMVTIIDRSHSDHHVSGDENGEYGARSCTCLGAVDRVRLFRRSDGLITSRLIGSATSGRAIGAQDTLRTARNRFVIQFFIVPDKGDSSDEKKTRRGQQICFARSTAAEIKIGI